MGSESANIDSKGVLIHKITDIPIPDRCHYICQSRYRSIVTFKFQFSITITIITSHTLIHF